MRRLALLLLIVPLAVAGVLGVRSLSKGPGAFQPVVAAAQPVTHAAPAAPATSAATDGQRCTVPAGPELVATDTVDEQAGVTYATDAGEDLKLDVFVPRNGATARPAVLLVHGGGWSKGDRGGMDHSGEQLARVGFVTFSADYLLFDGPRAGAPYQLDELRSAVRWIRANAAAYGVDPTRIGAFGGSAGGHLAAMLGTDATGPCTEGDRVAAVVSWSGPLDFSALGAVPGGDCPNDCYILKPMMKGYVGCSYADCPAQWAAASPVNYVTPDDPPMLLANSTREFVPLTQATTMQAALEKADVPVQFMAEPGRGHADAYWTQAFQPTADFLARTLTGHPAPTGTVELAVPKR